MVHCHPLGLYLDKRTLTACVRMQGSRKSRSAAEEERGREGRELRAWEEERGTSEDPGSRGARVVARGQQVGAARRTALGLGEAPGGRCRSPGTGQDGAGH